MSYQPRKIHLYEYSDPGMGFDDFAKVGGYFHNLGIYTGVVNFKYSTQAGPDSYLAKEQKIGPVSSSLLITEMYYILTSKAYFSFGGGTEVVITVDPQVRAGTSQNSTNIHGDMNLKFHDRFGRSHTVGYCANPEITEFKKDVIVPKGGYVWVTNSSASTVSIFDYYVTVVVKGFSFTR